MSTPNETVSGLINSQATILVKFTALYTNYGKDGDSRKTAIYLQVKLEAIQELWDKFNYNDGIISEHADPQDKIFLNYLNVTYDKVASIKNELKSKILTKLSEVNPVPQSLTPQTTGNTSINADVQLAKINIPSFTGTYTAWKGFHDLYVALIHNNACLTDVQKFYHLKSNISGEASNLISHLELTNANYAAAWEILNDRYENLRVLVFTQIKRLVSQPATSSDSAFTIKKLHDTTKESLLALQSLKIDTKSWDPLVIYILFQKLDHETYKMWELSFTKPKELPTIDLFLAFLQTRFQNLENVICMKPKSTPSYSGYKPIKSLAGSEINALNVNKTPNSEKNPTNAKCCLCSGNHKIFRCYKFKKLSADKRREIVRRNDLCFLCLSPDHDVECCTWTDGCKHCGENHNAMLHIHAHENNLDTNLATTATETEETGLISNHAGNTAMSGSVLLATALVKVKDRSGEFHTLRCLVDSGSQFSIITEAAAVALKLKRRAIIAPLSGIGGVEAGVSKTLVELVIKSQHTSFEIETEALVMRKVTNLTPYNVIRRSTWEHLTGLPLADPYYFRPGKIDLLLGSDICPYIQKQGFIIKDRTTPVAQETEFGWLLSGRVNGTKPKSSSIGRHVFHLQSDIDSQLQTFWTQEEVEIERILSIDEIECENHFKETHTRQEDGRYVVRLPFKKDIHLKLGNSRNQAIAVFLQMERKFLKDEHLSRYYKDFMREYETLGHMEKLPKTQLYEQRNHGSHQICYLPHHAVWKETSSTTKLRVVFNASSKTSTKVSLNQKLLVGPTIQKNLASIILSWRTHLVAFTADVQKMYRQILMDNHDKDFQRIVWRPDPSGPIQDYRLNTVTYGTSSAPFLAIRTLRQLAADEKERYPLASIVLCNQMYVDDCLSGADDIESAIKLQNELLGIISSAGMEFKKWASNYPELLQNVSEDARELQLPLQIEEDESIKALGVHWHPISDCFQFKVNLTTTSETITKRIFLSEAARLFDPLGWLAPTIIMAKIYFQKLWLEKLKWDDILSPDLSKRWIEFKKELPTIENIKIPRWVGLSKNCYRTEMHGFCDASMDAFAAVIYLRTIGPDGIKVSLLTAKTRVAPISQISLPRLELCGAELVTKLLAQTKTTLKRSDIELFAWTDSTIVLSWLSDHPGKWKIFIANRVAKIQKILKITQWRHVCSAENPADVASRGIMPSQLEHHPLWWQGPSWLKESSESWIPTKESNECPAEQELEKRIVHIITKSDFAVEFLNRHSSMQKLIVHTAWLRRFLQYLLNKKIITKKPLSVQERIEARILWYKIVQRAEYGSEISRLQQNKAIDQKSPILSLDPRLDKKGILRVGGRLKNATLSFDEKHPMLLPGKSVLSELIINEAHARTLHGGTQQVLAYIRNHTWIINARNAVKRQLHKCLVCYRQRAEPGIQLMGDLPPERVTICSTFTNTGVDYAGPITLRILKGPRNRTFKGYIAVFVCMATKAVHIELVQDLTAEGFLSAFSRFTSRRGIPANMYSDNGTNLVGANNLLADRQERAAFNHTIANVIAKDGTNWHFIPPAAPHMGGLWEAAIKSMKFHLKRCVGDVILDYIEMTTLLTKIEACLNSRPISPLTDDADDLNALSIGHLLIGRPLIAPPNPNITETPLNRIKRWHLVEKITQDFWKRWQTEYLQKLQGRQKWQQRKPENLNIGDLVLIRHENFPPTKWPMGRILELHPGKDGLTRVVTLKTQQSILQRPITKICRLPINEDTCTDIPPTPILNVVSTNASIENSTHVIERSN